MKQINLILASLIIFSSISCTQKKEYFEETGSVFHTSYSIKYEASKLMTEEIDAELQAVNMSLNPFNPNAIIAKVNRNEKVEIDEHFRIVFNKAMEISEKSGGMFDITCAPFINIWGFGFKDEERVTPEMIDSIKPFVGYQKIRIEGNQVVKDDPRIMLNASAIAKGYTCDVVADMLEAHGVRNYMVEIGGEVTAKGVNNQGIPWRIGIRKPEEAGAGRPIAIEEVVHLTDKKGVATSGDYQNYYVKEGKKYAHTINPMTGYPAEQNILSSTIIAENCMTADGWATAFTAMGLEEACRVGDSIPGLEYFFIWSDENGSYRFSYSQGMAKYLPNR
ncbi:thiamine biosynthesis lipoprotein [Parabacteroides sp. PFB2-10]|uniref:FAD:protein FMN transferase n=1 Tax=Parabacteroides sp. PFB2-10 TaxID=1742405 RepID=UPI0024771A2D|nr:FAD:protein FMN transferase [Parabacteroides sp. PFB2-10]MDH6311679.1 thiamine biosynthesis lipoprotein [Parabacteroides sp. PFB2-10]